LEIETSMSTMQIKWIVLPNGVAGGNFVFSVLVAPQLQSSVTELGVWPDVVRTLAPSLVVGGAAVPGLTLDTSRLNDTLWNALFPTTTPVAPYAFHDRTASQIVSFRARPLASAIKAAYAEV